MSSRYSEDGRIVRCYSVTDPTLHPRGYTVYKVVEKKLDVEAFDEAVQESVSWKRYNEFYKLYLSLSSLHASLHRKEVFPDFPKPQIFHRFDAEVIKDRMQSAQDLLNFIGQRRYLVESRAFKEFFQDLRVIETHEVPDILQPIRADGKSEIICISDSNAGNINVGSSFTEESEEIELGDDDEEDDDDDFEDGFSHTEDEDYDEFDDYNNNDDNEMFGSNYDSLSAGVGIPSEEETRSLDSLIVEHCMSQSLHVTDASWAEGASAAPTTMEDGDQSSQDGPREKAGSEEDLTLEFDKKSGGLVKKGFLKKSFFPVQAIWKTGKNLKHLLSASFHGSLPLPSKEELRRSRRQKLLRMLSTRGYIVEAARSIKEAKAMENSGRYGDAFDLYKAAIGTMLKGVQSDTNAECIEFVREKISRYLTKAEELYKLHLQCHEPYLFMPSNTNRFCRDISLHRGRLDDLEKFKVIGVLGKVMLVVDKSCSQSNTYVMKVYPKTSSPTRNQTNVVPSCVPRMVGLLRFYETETAIYALLPHVPSGTLWSYVAAYLQQTDSTPDAFDDARVEETKKEEEEEEEKSDPKRQTPETSGCDETRKVFTIGGLDDSDLFFEADAELSTDSKNDSSGAARRHGASNGGSESDFRDVLAKNTGQCLSLFSINSSEGDATPSTSLDSRREPETLDRTLIFSSLAPNEPSILELFDPISQKKDSEFLGNNDEEKEEPHFKNKAMPPIADGAPTFGSKATEIDPKSLVKRLSLGMSSSCSEISRKNDGPHVRVSSSSTTFDELDLSGCRRRIREPKDAALERRGRSLVLLPERHVKLWAAELVVAITSLHECGIVCRDLNPDNILMDPTGRIVLTYFCQWTTVEQRIKTSAVDDLYCAPELSSLVSKVTRASDWWSFGVILFELLSGMSLKFYRPCGISRHTTDFLPPHLSAEAQSLLKRLIVYNPSERIGPEEIKSHSFFRGIDWSSLER